MCAIAGILRFDAHPAPPLQAQTVASVHRALRMMAHRGPDGEGVRSLGAITLGHRRLALVGGARGAQPLGDARNAITVVANAEIYNHDELRNRVPVVERAAMGPSDCAVLPALYGDRGLQAFADVEGMFAAALWDEAKRQLVLARDAFGMKPLYWSRTPEAFVFASELRGILELLPKDRRRRFSARALATYFSGLCVAEPLSVELGIEQVPVGSVLVVDGVSGRLRTERWESETIETAADGGDLASVLLRSVERTLAADSSPALLLSGGVDSTLVALLAREFSSNLRGYHVTFPEKLFSESSHATRVADYCGIALDTLQLDEAGAASLCDRVFDSLDEPFADASALAVYAIGERIARAHKYALGGDGADELFAGYGWHQATPRDDERRAFPWQGVSAKEIFSARALREVLAPDFFLSIDRSRFIGERDYGAATCDLRAQLRHDQRTYLPQDILTKVDRMAMAHGVEVRLPYLNRSVANAAARYADCELQDGEVRKIPLRSLLRSWMPDYDIVRPKQGFSLPIDIWLWGQGPLRRRVQEQLAYGECVRSGIFRRTAIETLFEEHSALTRLRGYAIWTLYCFEEWYRRSGKDGDFL